MVRRSLGSGMVSRAVFQKDLPSLGMSEKSMSASRMARNRLKSVAPFARVPEVVCVVFPYIAMKGKTTQTTSGTRAKGATDFKRLRAMRDADIEFSDIPKLGKSCWKTARLTMPEPKDRLTIRVDHDVVQWLKKNGRGYQTRINAILRSYMEAKSGADR